MNLRRFYVLRHLDTYLDIKRLLFPDKLSWHIINWTFFNVETVWINRNGFDTCSLSTKTTLGIRADLKSSLKTLRIFGFEWQKSSGDGYSEDHDEEEGESSLWRKAGVVEGSFGGWPGCPGVVKSCSKIPLVFSALRPPGVFKVFSGRKNNSAGQYTLRFYRFCFCFLPSVLTFLYCYYFFLLTRSDSFLLLLFFVFYLRVHIKKQTIVNKSFWL